MFSNNQIIYGEKIGFIGLGKLGMPCAEAIRKKGFHVAGYDIAHKSSNLVEIRDSIEDLCRDRDIVFVATPTPHEEGYDGREPTSHKQPKDFNYESVIKVLTKCNKHMGVTQTLVLISTVLPGTIRKQFDPIITNTKLLYNPYLIAMGTVKEDFLNPEMMIAGGDPGDRAELIAFYQEIITTPVRWETGTFEEAECIKVFYNTFISMKISFVNMIQDMAMEIGHMDASKVANALAKSTKRITSDKYMRPGLGDGGPCHPRDNIALRKLSSDIKLKYDLFSAVMEARDFQAQKMSDYLLTFQLPIVFIENGFKEESELLDGSPSLLVAAWLEDIEDQMDMFNKQPIHYEKYLNEPAVYLCGRGPSQHIIDSITDGSILIDPWGDKEQDLDIPPTKKIIKYGTTECFH